MSKVLDNELLLQEEDYKFNPIEDEHRNEVAGLIETIKRHEQEIVDLKKELASARADLDAKDLFIRSQSNLIEELKAQNINRSIGDAKGDKCELAGGHEQ